MPGPASPTVEVRDLAKSFKVAEREAGLRAATASLFRRKHRTVHALRDVSFSVAAGEIVGVLGPNGAGKTTTMKTLSGLLHPTSGQVRVLGFEPRLREHDFLRRIALIMGNRNALEWDLPALDSFDLNRAVYEIPQADFVRIRDELIELLDVGDQVRKPVRQLSLGERMKTEIVGALLHTPSVLFLDEPTLGLDVTMQNRLREFITTYNQRYEATVLLTSHYMADVTALASRVLVVHHGSLLFDGPLRELSDRFSGGRVIEVVLSAPADLSAYGEVVAADDERVRLRIAKSDTARVAARLLADFDVADLTVEDPPIEEVIDQVFRSAAPAPAGGAS